MDMILIILMIGGSFIKSIISASVARETTSETRAKGYSIFYMMVNIGSFTGKSVIDPLRSFVGESAYIYINFFSAILCVLAFIAILLFYHSAHHSGEGKSVKEVMQGLVKVFSNGRLLILILIVTGFWIVQQQLYATMPKYVIRLAGETARPGWIANVNPFVVVVFVNLITQFMARRKALTSIVIGMFLIPVSAIVMAMVVLPEPPFSLAISITIWFYSPFEYCNKMIDRYYQELAKNEDLIKPAFTSKDIEQNIKENKMTALLTIEDPEQQYILAQKVFDEKLSVRDIEKLVKNLGKTKVQKKSKEKQLSAIYQEIECKRKFSSIATEPRIKLSLKAQMKNRMFPYLTK